MTSDSSVDDGTGDRPAPRPARRGRPPRIDRSAIVAAARSIPPESLTMQAVADELGVDPKSINYHVGDRDSLRELVAIDVFEARLADVRLPEGGDWQTLVRTFALALHDAVVDLGALAPSFHLPGARGLAALTPVERVVQALVDAGFGIEDVGRILTFVTETAIAIGTTSVKRIHRDVHPNVPEVIDALEAADASAFPVLRQVVAYENAPDRHPRGDQLDFGLTLVVAGLERMLDER